MKIAVAISIALVGVAFFFQGCGSSCGASDRRLFAELCCVMLMCLHPEAFAAWTPEPRKVPKLPK